MANVDDEVKLSLKVMINKENDKVLYAEADSDFADVLLSFLTLPLGKIVRLMEIHRGVDKIMELLRASFQSSTPLSDLIFHSKTMNNYMCDVREGLIPDESSSDSKNMIVKAWVNTTDESKNNLYVLEAGGDFVDFLFSLLVIPLGGVEWLLAGDSGLRSIDKLYQSVQDFIEDECFRESNMKRRLMKPKLPPYCLSKNQMFPLKEEAKPKLCFVERVADGDSNTTDEIISSRLQFKDPKGGESYVKSSASFFVDRNLYVFEFCEADEDHLKSDPNYKKLELHIGLKEALVILKASLTSDSAIKESLANLIFMKLGFIVRTSNIVVCW